MSTSLLVKLNSPDAKVPFKAHPDEDAGFDLVGTHDVTVKAFESAIVDIKLSLGIPKGYYGQLMTRSSMGKAGLRIHPGVIDQGYRGNITVIVVNLTSRDYEIHTGDKVAQLLILPVPKIKVEVVTELPESSRGEGGFGSSGR
jgi:dUTP pyrophosphatase